MAKILRLALTLWTFLLLAPLAEAKDLVYYIAGSPFNSKPDAIKEAVSELKKYMKRQHPSADFRSEWQGNWKDLCKDIKKIKPTRLILIGHSFGAQASVNIGYCLKDSDLKIDLLISLDTMQKFFDRPADLLSENVLWSENFYQTQDFFMRPYKKMRRENGHEDNLNSTHIKLEDTDASYHDELVRTLVKREEIQRLVDALLK